jgi:hypothetical protein
MGMVLSLSPSRTTRPFPQRSTYLENMLQCGPMMLVAPESGQTIREEEMDAEELVV